MKNKLIFTTIFSVVFLFAGCTQITDSTKETEKTEQKTDHITPEQASENALKAGDKMPSFELPNAKNETVKSEELLKDSNLVVVFYRGEWCPYCNMYLNRLQQNSEKFAENNAKLVAISVESPDDSLTVAEKNNLDFHVLSDKNLDLARKFKIVYEIPPKTNEKYKEKGIDLIVSQDSDKGELPLSATYIVDKNGEIKYAFLDPDYKKRLEAEEIIRELKKLS